MSAYSIGDSSAAQSGCICFMNDVRKKDNKEAIVISSGVTNRSATNIICDNPRLAFIKGLSYLLDNGFIDQKYTGKIHSSATIDVFAVVEQGSEIGAGVTIGPGSHIKSCVVLGANTKVGANCTLGHDGFGFERGEDGAAFRSVI